MAGPLTMEIEGLDKLIRGVKDQRILGPPIDKAMRQAGLAVQREAQERAPVDTGRLRADIKVVVDQRKPFPRFVRIGPKVFYAIFQELGTGIYGPSKTAIRPVRASMLAFRAGGKMIFRRSVKGVKPQPFMGPALSEARPTIGRVFARAMREIEAKWGRSGR